MKVSVRRLDVRRSARYYEMGDRSSAEIWIVLHGYGQLAANFIQRFEPVANGRRIIAPEALSRFYTRSNGPVGASWMTREDRVSEIKDYNELLDNVMEDAGAAAGRLVVVGFSQGAHTACRWTSTRDGVQRLIVWGSRLPDDVDLNALAHALQDGEVILVAGSRDRHVQVDELKIDRARLMQRDIRASIVRYYGGHDIDADTLRRIADHSIG